MNKIRTLLVDDEPISTKHLTALLTKYCESIEIVAKASNVDEALEAILISKPDLIFLDIELGGETGFDLLKKIEIKKFEVIFVTAHNQFGIEAIKAHALDYILKPINKVELILSVEAAVSAIQLKKQKVSHPVEQRSSRISLPTLEGLLFVEVNDIIFIESEGRYSRFHLSNNTKLLVSKNLGEFEIDFEGKGFARIHHSYIVNLSYIQKYIKGRGGYVVLKNGLSLEVSVRKKDDFLDRLE
jgi:two-component system LytT family response regulator